MRIKKLYATFGKLENKTLDLAPGLNIIYGENESGKSTWSAFIRAMFFGVSTREKAKAGYLPDKEKYLPWSGASMYGKLEGQDENGTFVIERTSGKTGVFSKESVTYPELGKSVLSSEELIGVSRGVYERSAFISQSGLGIDGDKETEKRILSIASSGDEKVSALEVTARLNKNLNSIKSKRGNGLLSDVLSEKNALSAKLSYIEQAKAEIAEVSKNLEETEKKLDEVCRSIKIAECEERKAREQFIERAKSELCLAQKRAEETAKNPTRADFDKFSDMKGQWQELALSCERGENELFENERRKAEISSAINSSPFSGMSFDRASLSGDEDKKRLSSKKWAMPLGFGVVALGAALFFVVKWFVALAAIVSGAVVVVVSMFAVHKNKRRLLEKYGTLSEKAISEALCEYERLTSELRTLTEKEEEKKLSYEREKTARDMRTKDLLGLLSEYGIKEEDVSQGERLLREKVSVREESLRALEYAKIRVEALCSATELQGEKIEYSEDEIPTESIDELRLRENSLSAAKKGFELNLAALRERIAGASAEETAKRISELSEKEEELTSLYEAYALAIEVMEEADSEIKGRFAPEIEKRASEIFYDLCGGSFEVVRIMDTSFDMEVAEGSATAPRKTLSLSAGTLDELYFSLRLALCEKILPENSPPPVIVDDAFVNFDDTRLHRALGYLKKMSETRQILVFSCHKREAEYFKNDDMVNKIKL